MRLVVELLSRVLWLRALLHEVVVVGRIRTGSRVFTGRVRLDSHTWIYHFRLVMMYLIIEVGLRRPTRIHLHHGRLLLSRVSSLVLMG